MRSTISSRLDALVVGAHLGGGDLQVAGHGEASCAAGARSIGRVEDSVSDAGAQACVRIAPGREYDRGRQPGVHSSALARRLAEWRRSMACDPSVFAEVPIFALLDADERAILADHVELRRFVARQRIYKTGDPGGRAYIVLNGRVEVHAGRGPAAGGGRQAERGDMFGLASMLAESAHLTTAVALEETSVIEIDRQDIARAPPAKAHGRARHADHGGQAVPGGAGAGPRAGHPQPERGDRRVRRRSATGWRIGWRASAGRGASSASFAWCWSSTSSTELRFGIPGTRTRTSCSICFCRCSRRIQAPVIMMSQNRQDAKDRLRGELDYRVNVKAGLEVSQVLERLSRVEDQLDTVLAGQGPGSRG